MPNNFGNDNEVRCSFCGKPQSQAKRLISGNGVYICDECVELCMDIIADEDSLHRGRPQPKNEPRAEMVLPKLKFENVIEEIHDETGHHRRHLPCSFRRGSGSLRRRCSRRCTPCPQ